MSLSRDVLELPSDPRSVQHARKWVGDVLHGIGREDLVDSAELGVSELVTNAILHAEPPITVNVGGTREHPRVEVKDHSHRPPQVNLDLAEQDHLLSTIGRGLGIVALYSQTWGSEIVGDGKTVWFEPTTEITPGGDLSGEVYDFDEEMTERLASVDPPEELLTIRLIDMPVQVFVNASNRFAELRRELRLLTLAHESDYPVAKDLTELFLQVEQERRQAKGLGGLADAISAGLERVDLEYHVPVSAPASMGRMLDMMDRADEFCRDQRLLALAASPQQIQLQRWYFGEFRRQADGGQPTRWHGSFVVEPPTQSQG